MRGRSVKGKKPTAPHTSHALNTKCFLCITNENLRFKRRKKNAHTHNDICTSCNIICIQSDYRTFWICVCVFVVVFLVKGALRSRWQRQRPTKPSTWWKGKKRRKKRNDQSASCSLLVSFCIGTLATLCVHSDGIMLMHTTNPIFLYLLYIHIFFIPRFQIDYILALLLLIHVVLTHTNWVTRFDVMVFVARAQYRLCSHS